MPRYLSLAVALLVGASCGSDSASRSDAGGGGGDGDGGSGDGDGGMSGPRTVKLTLPNRPTNATQFAFIVAFQDGSAPWQAAPPPTDDSYSFEINAPSYGVAFTCSAAVAGTGGAPVRSVTSAHFAVSERTELTLEVPARCTDRMTGAVTLSGNVSNRPFQGVLVVQFGSRSAFVGSQTGNFQLQTPPGTRDLIVSHAIPLGNGDFVVDEALVIRDVSVQGNTMRQINFDAAVPTTSYAVDVNVTNSRVVAGTTLYTASGTTASLVRRSGDPESIALADSQRVATDVYDQSIAVSTLGRGATITNATSTPGDQTWVAPAPLGMVTTTAPTAMPYVILESTWPAYANAVGYTWSATQQNPCANGSCSTVWTANLSPGVVGAMPSFRMPDLSVVPGWDADFELQNNSQVVGTVTAVTSSAGAQDFPTGIPAPGTQRAFVRADYGITP